MPLSTSKQKSTINKASDTNLGLVMMDLAWYEEGCFNHWFVDTKKAYQTLSGDDVCKFCFKAKSLINKYIVEKYSRQNLFNIKVEFIFSKSNNFEILNFMKIL